ncbi:MAG: hypothetical protein KC646_17625 [Candidatus Cloacimonetes bacterium]|nr:hypothetical protein [Candidatus Cloacimonadota bacterium]
MLTPTQLLKPVIDRFIQSIKDDQITDAYYLTHPKFQKNSNLSEFHKLCKFYKLNTISGSQIDSFNITKTTAKATGNLNYKSYLDIPVVFSLGMDEKAFKIIHLDFDLKTYFENNGMIAPTLPQMTKIVEKTFKDFHGAARKGSMKEFYEGISTVWKDDMEPYELNDLYANLMISDFVKHNFKTTKIKVNPISGVNKSGILICTGSIHSDLSISFEFQYYFEDGDFKPLSVRVKLLK